MLFIINKKFTFFFLVACAITFTNCTSKKKMIYFQGIGSIKADLNKSFTPILRTDDLLSITVMGLDAEAVKPFNISITSSNSNPGGYTAGIPSATGYLIDSEGMVDFPVIGKLKLAGLNRIQAIDLLKENLVKYINNPTINLRILNYKITVLGEVSNPGTFNIPNERVTLLEALGIAGDLNITAQRKNILVIRTIDGNSTETRIDLTSKDLFASPVYYLQQNDVVYVEPNRAKINSSVVNASNVGVVISIISLLTTMALLLSR